MSTVILTPTHIGSDHCIVEMGVPSILRVDVNHHKIFVNDDKDILYACVGEFLPDHMISNEVQEYMAKIVDYIYEHRAKDKFLKFNLLVKEPDLVSEFTRLFGEELQIMVVTATTRHLVRKTGDISMVCDLMGDYIGMGTGGTIGKGLIMSGTDIHDVWPIINEMITTSSVASTVIPLSILRPRELKKTGVKDGPD